MSSPGYSSTVERKMAQQLKEFQASQSDPVKTSQTSSQAASSSTTEGSSNRDGMTTSEMSRDAPSELESTESEKTQTSDCESEKHTVGTDSGGDGAHEDSRGDHLKVLLMAIFALEYFYEKNPVAVRD